MRTLQVITIGLFCILTACSSGPAFKDKVNEDAYKRVEMGQTYEQVMFQMGGLDGRKLTESMYIWDNGDIETTTYSITVSFEDGKAARKSATTLNEKGEKLKEERYPEM
jgi:hypothetical protein